MDGSSNPLVEKFLVNLFPRIKGPHPRPYLGLRRIRPQSQTNAFGIQDFYGLTGFWITLNLGNCAGKHPGGEEKKECTPES
jgi:hypothetical protein